MILDGWEKRIEDGSKEKELVGKELTKAKKGDWQEITTSRKVVPGTDVVTLGHQDVPGPAVVSRSSKKGILCRLVTNKPKSGGKTLEDLNKSKNDVEVIKEWKFEDDDEVKPVFFTGSYMCKSDVWVEAKNPNKKNAAVTASLTVVFQSKV